MKSLSHTARDWLLDVREHLCHMYHFLYITIS